MLLDRDGVLNVERVAGWLDDPEQWVWCPGAEQGVARLAEAGVEVSIVTNQSGIGRGAVTAAAVASVHRWLADELRGRGVRLVGIQACPHRPSDGCRCRKPAPGLVAAAVAAGSVPASAAVLIGDDHRDLEAAAAAGVAAVLVRTGKGREVEASGHWAGPVHDDLAAAVAALVPARWTER